MATRGKYNFIDLSYMAGWMDGEGSVSITKVRDIRKKGESWQYILIVNTANLHKGVLQWIINTFSPGRKLSKSFYRKNHFAYQWQVRDRNALELLKILLPYLKVKKEIAKVGIEFQERKMREQKRGIKLTEKDWEWREKYRQRMKKMYLSAENLFPK